MGFEWVFLHIFVFYYFFLGLILLNPLRIGTFLVDFLVDIENEILEVQKSYSGDVSCPPPRLRGWLVTHQDDEAYISRRSKIPTFLNLYL